MIRAVGEKVLVKQDLPKDDIINGLVRMDEGVMRRPWEREGVVYAIGDENPKGLKIGDRIILRLYFGRVEEIRGEEYTIINQENVLAVIPDDVPGPVFTDGQGFW